MNVSNSDDIVGRIMLAGSKVSFEALHDIEVKISGLKVTDMHLKIRAVYIVVNNLCCWGITGPITISRQK